MGNIGIIRPRYITIKPPQYLLSLLNTTLHNITSVLAVSRISSKCCASLKLDNIAMLPGTSSLRTEGGALLGDVALPAYDGDVASSSLGSLVAGTSAAISNGVRGACEGG